MILYSHSAGLHLVFGPFSAFFWHPFTAATFVYWAQNSRNAGLASNSYHDCLPGRQCAITHCIEYCVIKLLFIKTLDLVFLSFHKFITFSLRRYWEKVKLITKISPTKFFLYKDMRKGKHFYYQIGYLSKYDVYVRKKKFHSYVYQAGTSQTALKW